MSRLKDRKLGTSLTNKNDRILVGYFIAYFSFLPWIHRHCRVRERDPDALQPEARLYWLLWVAPLLSIGLFGFAWTSLGPPNVHWIAPMIFSCLIAIANVGVYRDSWGLH